jgi:phosphoribosylglycinamide formyltransferase-1
MPMKIALLASGRGSNVQAICEAIANQQLDAQVVCLIANVAQAPVLDYGPAFNIPTHCLPSAGMSRQAHEAQVLSVLQSAQPDYVVLAGYMRLLSSDFLKAIAAHDGTHYRVVNIHPSLLPAFPGTNAYQDAYDYGVQVAGATVHFVDEQMDHGPILCQAAFERRPGESFESFKSRGLALEHQIYPQALQWLAQGRVRFRPHATTGRTTIEVLSYAAR